MYSYSSFKWGHIFVSWNVRRTLQLLNEKLNYL